MKEEVKQAWVEALESGEYEQGFGWLRQTVNGKTCHCALGVLGDLAVKAGLAEWLEGVPGTAFLRAGDSEEFCSLPDGLPDDWLPLEGDDAKVGEGVYVSGLNDNGTSFAQIAALLRATPAEEL